MDGYREEGITLVPCGKVFMRVHQLAEQGLTTGGAASTLAEASVYDELIQHNDSQYVLRLTIDPSAYGMIIGKGGAALKSLQGK